MPAPKEIILNIESACNLRCSYCFQKSQINSPHRIKLTLGQVKLIEERISKYYKSFLKPRIFLVGGEPTINPEFVQIVKFLNSKKYDLTVVTNGLELDKFYAEIIPLNNSKIVLSISIHSTDYDYYLQKIKAFYCIFDKRNYYLVVSVTMNYLIENSVDIEQFIRKFQDSGIKYILFLHSLDALSLGQKIDFPALELQFRKLKKEKFKIPYVFYPALPFDKIKPFYADKEFPDLTKKCFYPWQGMQILPDGRVMLCPESGSLGNLLADSANLFINDQARAFRNNIRNQGPAYNWCRRCFFRIYY